MPHLFALVPGACMRVRLDAKALLSVVVVQVVEQLGGTIDDSLLVDGLCLKLHAAGSIKRVKNAKIGLAQFCLSPPKTDMEVHLRSCRSNAMTHSALHLSLPRRTTWCCRSTRRWTDC